MDFMSLGSSGSLEMHIFSGGSKLLIARSQLSDSGTYSCLASNVEGKARKDYQLIVQGPCQSLGFNPKPKVRTVTYRSYICERSGPVSTGLQLTPAVPS